MKNIIISLSLFFSLFLIPHTVNAGTCTSEYWQNEFELLQNAALAYEFCEGNGICQNAVEVAYAVGSAENSAVWALCCALYPSFC